MNFTKCLVFCTSILCTSVIIIPGAATTVNSQESNQQISEAYKNFINETISATKISGIVDLTGIDLASLNEEAISNICDAITSVYDEIKTKFNRQPIVLFDKSQKENSEYIADKINIQNDWEFSFIAEEDSAPVIQAFRQAKMTDVMDIASYFINENSSSLKILQAKLARLTVSTLSELPPQVVISSHRYTDDYVKRIEKIAERYNIKVHKSDLGEQISLAINLAYASNILDLRFLDSGQSSKTDGNVAIFESNIAEFIANYSFDAGAVKVLIGKKGEWYNEIKEICDDKKMFKIMVGEVSDAYVSLYENALNIAKEAKILNVAQALIPLASDKENDYLSKLVIDTTKKMWRTGPLAAALQDHYTVLYLNNKTEQFYDCIENNCFSKSKKNALSKFETKVLKANGDTKSLGVSMHAVGWLAKQMNFAYKTGCLTLPYGVNMVDFGPFIATMFANKVISTQKIPVITLYGQVRMEVIDLLKKMQVTVKNAISDLDIPDMISDIEKVTNTAYMTDVFDLSNLNIGIYKKKNTIDLVIANIENILANDISEKPITVLVGISNGERSDRKALAELKKLQAKYKNLKIQSVKSAIHEVNEN